MLNSVINNLDQLNKTQSRTQIQESLCAVKREMSVFNF